MCFTQIQLYLSKYHHIYPMCHCICLQISLNNTAVHCLCLEHHYKAPLNALFLLIQRARKMHFSQALYNALLYSSDNSVSDCDSSHGSSHFSNNACTYNPSGGSVINRAYPVSTVPSVTCHMLGVTCHMSCVKCLVYRTEHQANGPQS